MCRVALLEHRSPFACGLWSCLLLAACVAAVLWPCSHPLGVCCPLGRAQAVPVAFRNRKLFGLRCVDACCVALSRAGGKIHDRCDTFVPLRGLCLRRLDKSVATRSALVERGGGCRTHRPLALPFAEKLPNRAHEVCRHIVNLTVNASWLAMHTTSMRLRMVGCVTSRLHDRLLRIKPRPPFPVDAIIQVRK
jgi:hypothetical protein